MATAAAAANTPFPRNFSLRLSVPPLGMEKLNIVGAIPRGIQSAFLIATVYSTAERRWMYPPLNGDTDLRDLVGARHIAQFPPLIQEDVDVSAADTSQD